MKSESEVNLQIITYFPHLLMRSTKSKMDLFLNISLSNPTVYKRVKHFSLLFIFVLDSTAMTK